MELFLKLGREERIAWSGEYRSPLKGLEIAPRPVQPEIPVWVGVGCTPESAANARRLGLGMNLALLGGSLERAKPMADLYWQAGREAGHDRSKLRIAVSSHG